MRLYARLGEWSCKGVYTYRESQSGTKKEPFNQMVCTLCSRTPYPAVNQTPFSGPRSHHGPAEMGQGEQAARYLNHFFLRSEATNVVRSFGVNSTSGFAQIKVSAQKVLTRLCSPRLHQPAFRFMINITTFSSPLRSQSSSPKGERMSRKLYLRLVLLLGLLVLVLAPTFTTASPAPNACTDCRRACFRDYQACIASGQIGCDDVLADCNASCPCP
jgi:hypothetical protein